MTRRRLMLATPAGDVEAPRDRAGLVGKLTVINGEGGPRLAKLTARKRLYAAMMAVKSEASPALIVPVDRLRFRGRATLVKGFGTLGELRKKLPYSGLPLTAPTDGSAPRWEHQPIPDFADIYFQPESDARNKLAREQQSNRRRADARRNVGIYSFHGEANQGVPELRYEPDQTLGDPAVHGKPSKRQRTALVVPRRLDRLAAGAPDQGALDEGDEDDAEKKKRRRRFGARRRR